MGVEYKGLFEKEHDEIEEKIKDFCEDPPEKIVINGKEVEVSSCYIKDYGSEVKMKADGGEAYFKLTDDEFHISTPDFPPDLATEIADEELDITMMDLNVACMKTDNSHFIHCGKIY